MKRMKKGFKKLLSLCMVIETVFSSIPMVHAEELEKTISSPVLITEIVPNTDNMNKLDAYEYYELMNISDQDVNLSDYNIVYVNDTKTSIWKTNVQVLPAGEKMLVWPFFRWLSEFPERRMFRGLPRGCWHCELLGICRRPKEDGWKCYNGCRVMRSKEQPALRNNRQLEIIEQLDKLEFDEEEPH